MRRLSDVHLTITRSLTLPSTFMGVGKVNCALRIHFVFCLPVCARVCVTGGPFLKETWRKWPFTCLLPSTKSPFWKRLEILSNSDTPESFSRPTRNITANRQLHQGNLAAKERRFKKETRTRIPLRKIKGHYNLLCSKKDNCNCGIV